MKHKITLQYLLISGALYFFTVSVVHFLGIKLPMFFIYYNVDSYVYQDRIISVVSFICAVFLYSGYKLSKTTLEIVKYIIVAEFVAIFGLIVNNFTRLDFRTNLIYWLEIGVLILYLLSLILFYSKSKIKK